MADMLSVPAGLIMRILGEEIHVFVSSRTEGNPYHPGARRREELERLVDERTASLRDKKPTQLLRSSAKLTLMRLKARSTLKVVSSDLNFVAFANFCSRFLCFLRFLLCEAQSVCDMTQMTLLPAGTSL